MHGLMMDRPLLISALLTHAESQHGDQELHARTGLGHFEQARGRIDENALDQGGDAASLDHGDRHLGG